MRRFVAPGKVVLLGEYAVLDGAPAIVAAVDHGVACTVTDAERLTWSTPGADDRFVAAALTAAAAPAAHYAFTDWNPVDLPSKAGLGGSAAATACALAAARVMAGAPLDPEQLHRSAAEVHHAVQGSEYGIDIAAACHGGVLQFRAGTVQPAPGATPTVVFSGTSSATGPRVDQYLAWPQRSAFVTASTRVVERWQLDPVGALRQACRLLSDMTDQAGIQYWTDGLRALVELADVCGGAAKPSGAGGGDIVVALFHHPEQDAEFRQRAVDDGFCVIPTVVTEGARELHHG